MIAAFPGFAAQKKVLEITHKKSQYKYAERDEQKREEFIAEIEALTDDIWLYYVDK